MHGLGNLFITNREAAAALFWGWGALWRHWAARVGEELPFGVFHGRHKVSEVFYVAGWRWDSIPTNSWGVIQGKLVSGQKCCTKKTPQISNELCSVTPQNHQIPESKMINPTLSIVHMQPFPQGWARGYIWAECFFYGIVGSWSLYFSLLCSWSTQGHGLWDISHRVGPCDHLDMLLVTGINPIPPSQNFPKKFWETQWKFKFQG